MWDRIDFRGRREHSAFYNACDPEVGLRRCDFLRTRTGINFLPIQALQSFDQIETGNLISSDKYFIGLAQVAR